MYKLLIATLTCLTGLAAFIISRAQEKHQAKSEKVTYNYGAFVDPDSNKKIFLWNDMHDFRHISGGPIYFEFKDDSTIIKTTGRGAIYHSTFKKIRLTSEQQKLVPVSLLDNTYQLLGVFTQPEEKGDGFYIAYYFNHTNKNVLTVWHESVIGFVIGLCYFSTTKENDFKNANFFFPYRNKIRF